MLTGDRIDRDLIAAAVVASLVDPATETSTDSSPVKENA